MWGSTCGGRTPSSCIDSICPSFRAAPRMRHRALASLSAFLSVRYALKPSCLAFSVGEKKLLTCTETRFACVAQWLYRPGKDELLMYTHHSLGLECKSVCPTVMTHQCVPNECERTTIGVRLFPFPLPFPPILSRLLA